MFAKIVRLFVRFSSKIVEVKSSKLILILKSVIQQFCAFFVNFQKWPLDSNRFSYALVFRYVKYLMLLSEESDYFDSNLDRFELTNVDEGFCVHWLRVIKFVNHALSIIHLKSWPSVYIQPNEVAPSMHQDVTQPKTTNHSQRQWIIINIPVTSAYENRSESSGRF